MAPRAVPLAVIADVDTATPKTLYVHADHLDRPVRMSDSGKALVWDAVYRPFGAVVSITGSASLNARFPGAMVPARDRASLQLASALRSEHWTLSAARPARLRRWAVRFRLR